GVYAFLAERLRVKQKLDELRMLSHRCRAEFTKQMVPVRVLAVQTLKRRRNLLVRKVPDDRRVPYRRIRRPGEPPCELQENRQALVRVMDSRDFQLWKVKPLTKHV